MRSRWGRRTPAAALFWRLLLGNGAVFVAGSAVLVLSPATVSTPILVREIAVLVVGLALLLAVNAVLIRSALRPLAGLTRLMDRVDLLRPGERLTVRGGRDLGRLVGTFNDMLDRLETERSASSAHALAAQEGERHRIAQELHDEIGQSLTAVLLGLKRTVDRAPADLQDELREAQEAIRASLDEVRQVARRLRPGVLEDLGLLSAMRALATDFTEASEVPVVQRLDQQPPPLSPNTELVLYRIAQESLNNVIKHSGASKVNVSIRHDNRGVELTIRDDGKGFEPTPTCVDGSSITGFGLTSIAERARLLGGSHVVESTPGRGTTITVSIPPEP